MHVNDLLEELKRNVHPESSGPLTTENGLRRYARRGMQYPDHPTVLHALHAGWKLLGPPVREDYGGCPDRFIWWLTRD